jgi:hypothetical protein
MMRKVLLTPEKEAENPAQRNRIFGLLVRPKIGYEKLSWTMVA